MPLAFESLSHGSIAFGFFNIESDMLLCDRYFLFADEFCKYVEDIAENAGRQTYQTTWKVQIIQTADAIGDLMGAIRGIRYTGFIGALYRCFPFPPEAENSEKLYVVSVAHLLGEAIRRINNEESVSSLFV